MSDPFPTGYGLSRDDVQRAWDQLCSTWPSAGPECPDGPTLIQYGSGGHHDDAFPPGVVGHVRTCDRCSKIVGALRRSVESPSPFAGQPSMAEQIRRALGIESDGDAGKE